MNSGPQSTQELPNSEPRLIMLGRLGHGRLQDLMSRHAELANDRFSGRPTGGEAPMEVA